MNEQNTKLSLAHDFITNTQHNIYLTGKAGTGKTTFLHSLQQSPPKRMIVTAPTGVAAINAHGVTLHSFFQLPFGPFVPGSDAVQRRFNRDKINIIKSLDLLVIDEISMVRADVLDAVDSVLRRYRRSNLPFGGIQLLMIGDLHQLSPVVKNEELTLLQNYYTTNYFFGSIALQQTNFISIELEHIYRQSDSYFIELLNRVRDNNIDRDVLEQLNTRCISGQGAEHEKLPITLSSHNYSAKAINDEQLATLSTKAYTFEASVVDDYPEHAYPTEKTLTLKLGAQVMFTRNDRSPEKRYYNGKIATISQINHRGIQVKCPDDALNITLEPATWENIKYVVDPETKDITETIIGTFTQYPLRLAWAITIHKSQGLTFDTIILDVDNAFAHGQVYVALSRCKTLEGITLRKKIAATAIKTDVQIEQFVHRAQQNPPTQEQLKLAKISYQQKLIEDCFNFQLLWNDINRLGSLLSSSQNLIRYTVSVPIPEFQQQVYQELVEVSEKFHRQLQSLYAGREHLNEQSSSDELAKKEAPQDSLIIQERIQKAAAYFLEKLNCGFVVWLRNLSYESDNQELYKKMRQLITSMNHHLSVKIEGISSCQSGFSTSEYLQAIAAAEIDIKPSSSRKSKSDYLASDLANPELFHRLKSWRDKKADDLNVGRHTILHQKIIVLIAVTMPLNLSALKKIKGVGKRIVEKYGEPLIGIVQTYCQEKNIDTCGDIVSETDNANSVLKKKAEVNNTDTKKVSYDLFRAGNSIEQIAQQRNFVASTIEGHLAHYIELGELDVTEVVKDEKVNAIQEALSIHQEKGFKFIKEFLGNDVSYGEIKMVKAHLLSKV